MKVRLTDPQAGALECRPLDDDEAPIADAWDGESTLSWEPHETDALLSALTEASNAEDAQYTEDKCQFARRASEVLTRISNKVLKAHKNHANDS